VTQQEIIKSAKIRFIQWDDDYVIFAQLSGDTHHLDGISGELICLLSEQAMSRAELLKKLNELFEDATELELENYLDDFIAKFQKLGLLDIEKSEVN
jgi:PqqD family protein of HPr-rel-A system